MLPSSRISDLLRRHKTELLAEWQAALQAAEGRRFDLISKVEQEGQCREFLDLLGMALEQGDPTALQTSEWQPVRDFLATVSRSLAVRGFTPSETATFVFSFKQPLFALLQKELSQDAAVLFEEIWRATELLDKLGLWTLEVFLKSREEVIHRQQQDMLELSTPVVKLWDGILALPLVGTLDSSRTQVVMENLLQAIVETGSDTAIIDITGVPTVDTLVAQHLMRTIAAARLMGADCIVSGIRPQIAQTIVHLAIDLGNVITKSTLADAFAVALQKTGRSVRTHAER